MSNSKGGVVQYLQEFSIPLIAGVVCALIAANQAPEWYGYWFGTSQTGWGAPWVPNQ